MGNQELKLSEEERLRLESLFLRLELWNREQARCEQEKSLVLQEIEQFMKGILEREKVEASGFTPVFENFRLQKVLIEKK